MYLKQWHLLRKNVGHISSKIGTWKGHYLKVSSLAQSKMLTVCVCSGQLAFYRQWDGEWMLACVLWASCGVMSVQCRQWILPWCTVLLSVSCMPFCYETTLKEHSHHLSELSSYLFRWYEKRWDEMSDMNVPLCIEAVHTFTSWRHGFCLSCVVWSDTAAVGFCRCRSWLSSTVGRCTTETARVFERTVCLSVCLSISRLCITFSFHFYQPH